MIQWQTRSLGQGIQYTTLHQGRGGGRPCIGDEASVEDRVHNVQVLKDLYDEQSALEESVEAIEHEIIHAQEDLDALIRDQRRDGYP